MKKMKKILSLILVFALALSMMAGCGEPEDGANVTDGTASDATTNPNTDPTTPTTPSGNGNVSSYTVAVKTAGGMVLNGLSVYVYTDENLSNMVDYGELDDNGIIYFDLEDGVKYYVAIEGAPKGYDVKEYYTFNGTSALITLTSSVNTNQSLSEVSSLKLGDVMPDFEVLLPSGEKFRLSEALKEKDMVLINFWYTTCSWCIKEFPFMEEAYQLYKDDIEIIALNHVDGSNDAVAGFQASNQLTFPMAACPAGWFNIFGTQGAPTSIVVDRYGVICHIEEGALTSLRPFTSLFDYFTGADYKQRVLNSLDEIISNVKPTYKQPTSEEIGAVINSGDINVTYKGEPKDEYNWPFIITEKNGVPCVKSSNSLIEASYSILHAEVEMKAGQAVSFDYLISSERGSDVLAVIVDGEDIYMISGVNAVEKWERAYPWVATEDGTYTISFCYLKDDSTDEGDDCVYVTNLRICDVSEIDKDTYLPRQAATVKDDGFEYDYVKVFLNSKDGYYHVGSVNGPLLLVNMTANYTEFNDSKTLWNIVYDDGLMYKGESLYDKMTQYFSYASNSSLIGYCTVNEELAGYLKAIAELVGFSDDENEWLKMCIYYAAYGKNVKQLEDPIRGLAAFSAPEAKLGKNVSTNYFYYDTAIIPRGKLAKFVPTKSGVYRITSRSQSTQGVDGWVFDQYRNPLYTYEMDERMYNDSDNVSMVLYMEAGKSYFIDIAFWDVYEVGYIYFDIEYVAATVQHFRLASHGYFTYDSDASGDAMYHLIAGGIDVVLGKDGYYYEDLGNGKLGSKLYADFTGVTSLFSNPIATVNSYDENGNLVLDANGNPVKIKGMIDMGGFDFSKSENDLYILGIMAKYDNDVDATRKYLKDYWGADYDANAEEYKIEEVFNGKYHGYMLDAEGNKIPGVDYTEKISKYLSKMYNGSATERVGCVEVDAELAQILQYLMDKYTFEGVEDSWKKLCYYYDYLGPNA